MTGTVHEAPYGTYRGPCDIHVDAGKHYGSTKQQWKGISISDIKLYIRLNAVQVIY